MCCRYIDTFLPAPGFRTVHPLFGSPASWVVIPVKKEGLTGREEPHHGVLPKPAPEDPLFLSCNGTVPIALHTTTWPSTIAWMRTVERISYAGRTVLSGRMYKTFPVSGSGKFPCVKLSLRYNCIRSPPGYIPGNRNAPDFSLSPAAVSALIFLFYDRYSWTISNT